MKIRNGLLASLLALSVFACGGAQQQDGKGGSPAAPDPLAFLSQTEKEVIIETNKARAENGMKPLTANEKCTTFAREQSADMNLCHYFEHVRPACAKRKETGPADDESFEQRAERRGFTRSMVAENILQAGSARMTPFDAVDGWMHSPHHRDNILNKDIRSMGVGVVGRYWSQCFTNEKGIPVQ